MRHPNTLPEDTPSVNGSAVDGVSVFTPPPGHYYRDEAQACVDKGWSPVPIIPGDKRPGWIEPKHGRVNMPKWQRFCVAQATAEDLKWLTAFQAGLGIACGFGGILALDIDKCEHADACEEIAFRHLGPTSLIRTRDGVQRRVLVYRCADTVPPRTIPGLIDLLTHGRQFVAFGQHPDGSQYTWAKLSPADAGARTAPLVTIQKLNECMDELSAYAKTHNVVGKRGHHVVDAPVGQQQQHEPTAPIGAGVIGELLAYVPPFEDWARWTKVALILRAEGGTQDQFEAWSQLSPNYSARECAKRWASATPKRNNNLARVGSLIKMAEDAGCAVPQTLKDRVKAERATATPVGSVVPQDAITQIEARIAAGEFVPGEDRALLKAARAPREDRDVKPTMTIEQLRAATRDTLKDVFSKASHRRQMVLHPKVFRFKTDSVAPLVHVAFEETGAGKTTSFVSLVANEYRERLTEGENIVAFVKNHANANEMRKSAIKHGLDARDVLDIRGADQKCTNDALRPLVKLASAEGITKAVACDGCETGKAGECPYRNQFAPARGKLIIMQAAHLRSGVLPPLVESEDGAKPGHVFMSFIDEGVTSEMLRVSEVRSSDLSTSLDIVAKPTRKTKHKSEQQISESDAKRVDAAKRDARTLKTIAIRLLKSERDTSVVMADNNTIARARIPADVLAAHRLTSKPIDFTEPEAFKPLKRTYAYSWRDKIIGENGIKTRFDNEATQLFREKSKGKRLPTMRGALGHKRRVLSAIAHILEVADANADRLDKLSTMHVIERRSAAGKVTRSIGVASVAAMPDAIANGNVIFSDATGSWGFLQMLMAKDGRERDHEWSQSQGRASRPHATYRKVLSAPVSASQIGSGGRGDAMGGDEASVTSETQTYTRGKAKVAASTEINLKHSRTHSNARALERWLMCEVFTTRAANADAVVAIIGPKALITALKGRAWTQGVIWGHHGAVAGQNAFQHAAKLIVIGQARPPIWAAEDIALAYALKDRVQTVVTTGSYGRVDVRLSGQDAVMRTAAAADPFVAEAIKLLCDGQSTQVYGRLRATNRLDASQACELVALDQVATSEIWDTVESFAPVHPVEAHIARHGRAPVNARDAQQASPEVFDMGRHAVQVLLNDWGQMQTITDVVETPISVTSEASSITIGVSTTSVIDFTSSDPRSPLCGFDLAAFKAICDQHGGRQTNIAKALEAAHGIKISAQKLTLAMQRHKIPSAFDRSMADENAASDDPGAS